MRTKIVAGNWKMNKTLSEATAFIQELNSSYTPTSSVQVILLPPFPYLMLPFPEFIYKGAQNVSEFINGAYTGEVSAQMLQSLNVKYCIVGHSERRKYFNENNNTLLEKTKRLLEQNISPIFCIGETLQERENHLHFTTIKNQLQPLLKLSNELFKSIIIAYEPVWAIGTGKNATSNQAEEMHQFIRQEIAHSYNPDFANHIHILYGGSCNPKNAPELFSMPNIDGGLIGGASLNVSDFLSIINAASV
jgi:triosephosphate isomerase